MKFSISSLLVLSTGYLATVQAITNVASSLPKVSKSYSVLADQYGSAWISIPECGFSVNRYSFGKTIYIHLPLSSCPPGTPALKIYSIEQDGVVPDRVVEVDSDNAYRCFRTPDTDIEVFSGYSCFNPLDIITTTTTATTTTATTTTDTGNKLITTRPFVTLTSTSTSTTTKPITTTTTTTTKPITTTTTITTATASTTLALKCSKKDTFYGKKRGNGMNGDCCKDQRDCVNQCIRGKCNGPVRGTKTTTTTAIKKTTTTAKPTKISSACKAGFKGLKNGKGRKDACCTTHWDCKEECVKGRCN